MCKNEAKTGNQCVQPPIINMLLALLRLWHLPITHLVSPTAQE